MTEKVFTNCYLILKDSEGLPSRVCLGLKKRGFGQGLWNGAGGKPEANETIGQAVIREINEEFRVKVTVLDKRGEIEFITSREQLSVMMHVYLATKWEGDPVETEEMNPEWFEIHQVPYSQMWESDKEWLPIILSGKKIKAKYTYTGEGGILEHRDINEIETFT